LPQATARQATCLTLIIHTIMPTSHIIRAADRLLGGDGVGGVVDGIWVGGAGDAAGGGQDGLLAAAFGLGVIQLYPRVAADAAAGA